MKELLYVFIGGGTGSILRYSVSLLWKHLTLQSKLLAGGFPWPTFIANLLGCFLIGLFYKYAEQWGLSAEVRLLLTTGLCGGFTTFSTFSYEGLSLLQSGCYGMYACYLILSIVLGLLAAFVPTLL